MKNRLQQREKVWLIGASDGIGKALAIELQEQPEQHEIYISARRETILQQLANQYNLISMPCDVLNTGKMTEVWQKIPNDVNRIVFLVADYIPMNIQNFSNEKTQMCHHLLKMNLGSFIDLLGVILPNIQKRFEESGHITHLSIVSSVASYVGLPNGLMYGASKAALTHMAETLASEGHTIGLEISVIHPGFVKSQLTAKNDFPMPFILEPQQAAQRIISGWKKGSFEILFPKRLAFLLKFLRHLPYSWQLFLTKKIKS